MKLFLAYTAQASHRPVTRLSLPDLSSQRVLDFLQMIEGQRHNKPQTRNQRLAALHTFYRFLAVHHPEMLAEAQRVEAIPNKRTQPTWLRRALTHIRVFEWVRIEEFVAIDLGLVVPHWRV